VQNVWVFVGLGVVIVVLVLLIVRAVGNSKGRKIRTQLGLPGSNRVSPKHALAFRAFEDTDIRLKTSFPTMPDPQRQAMAREVLRNKGLLPKRNKVEALRRLRISKVEAQLSSNGIGSHLYTYGWNRVVARDDSAEAWMAEGRNNAAAAPGWPIAERSEQPPLGSRVESAIKERTYAKESSADWGPAASAMPSRPWPMVHPV
jgi:hypothetical protein